MRLAPILAAALAVRLAGVGDRLSADEGYTWLVASASGAGTFLDRLAAYENTPPLYYLLTWPLPAGDEAWLRLVSVAAGIGCVAAVWWLVRAIADERAALLSALALAVAPFAVSYSNYARGFVLADLGLIVATAGVLRRSWPVYWIGAGVALYSEYDSALFVIALVVAAKRFEWRAALPALFLVPWIPELVRALDAVGESKVSPVYPGLSPGSLRDVVVRLAFGEHGTADALGLRWVQFALVAAVLIAAARLARQRILVATALGTIALHAVAAWIGSDVFAPRYLTELIPIAAVLVGIAATRVPRMAPAVAIACVALGAAVFVQREGRELEPDYSAALGVVAKGTPVITNSAVVKFYFREAVLDRPFGLGPGLEAACVDGCESPFVVVDDTRIAGGARPGPGPVAVFGPIHVRFAPKEAGVTGVVSGGDSLSSLACSLALLLATSLGGGYVAHPMEVTVQDDALLLHRPPAEVQRTARRLAALGTDRVRITAGWSALAPEPRNRRRPGFDAQRSEQYPPGPFRQLDTAIKAVTGAGMKAQIDLAFWAPRWAVKREVKQRDRQRWRPDPAAYGDFVHAVARRYNGGFPDPTSEKHKALPAVRMWTTWNEPNHPAFLLPQSEKRRDGTWRDVAPHIYRTMHEVGYAALKRVNIGNAVLMGGLSSRGASQPGPTRAIPPMRFLREMACLDEKLEPLNDPACRNFRPLKADGFSYHPYSFEAAPNIAYGGPETVHLADLERLSGLLGELHKRGRITNQLPLYLTEYGYETNPPDTGRGIPPETQARYMSLATFEAWKRPETRMFAQFLFQDIADPASYQTGILYPDGRDKPAVQAFKLPFWAESREVNGQQFVLVWGQVRPGKGEQRVELELQGQDGIWRPQPSLPSKQVDSENCPEQQSEFLTDRDGFYLRALPYQGVMAYRVRWIRPDGGSEYGVPVTVGAPAAPTTP